LLARLVRRAWRRRHGLVRIGYPDGRVVEVTPGTTVLEASRLAGIPHASVCGGRGRCSTCRVGTRGGTTVGVTRLAGPAFMIEIEAVAVVNS
jgi:adenylate cyclase